MSGFGAWHPLTPSWVPGATAIWAVTALSCVCNYCRSYPTSGKCALVCGYAYWGTDCASFSVVRCAWVHCRMRPHQRERALVCGHVAVGKVALSLSVVWCSCSLPTVFPFSAFLVAGSARWCADMAFWAGFRFAPRGFGARVFIAVLVCRYDDVSTDCALME